MSADDTPPAPDPDGLLPMPPCPWGPILDALPTDPLARTCALAVHGVMAAWLWTRNLARGPREPPLANLMTMTELHLQHALLFAEKLRGLAPVLPELWQLLAATHKRPYHGELLHYARYCRSATELAIEIACRVGEDVEKAAPWPPIPNHRPHVVLTEEQRDTLIRAIGHEEARAAAPYRRLRLPPLPITAPAPALMAPVQEETAESKLTDTEQAVLKALEDGKARQAKQLPGLTGAKLDYLRRILPGMVRRGLIEHGPDGYYRRM